MKLITIFILIFIFASACSTAPGNVAVNNTGADPSMDKLPTYADAVSTLSKKVAMELKNPEKIREYSPETKSFFIFNARTRGGEESELTRRFIDDLIGGLVKEGVRIKREKVATWARAAGKSDEVDCREVLETAAADFLMGFSLGECPDLESCMEAGVEVTPRESNDVRFAAREAFRVTGAAARWHRLKHDAPPPKGSRENPYADAYEAAKYMVGRLSCLTKMMTSISGEVRVAVGKTDNTPVGAAHAFSEAASYYGFEQVISRDKWLPVALRAGDRFELGMYRKKHRGVFETANVVLALDMSEAGDGFVAMQAKMMALKDIEILEFKTDKRKKIGAGTVFPYCTVRGYSRSAGWEKNGSAGLMEGESASSVNEPMAGGAPSLSGVELETPVKKKRPPKSRPSVNRALRSEAARAEYKKNQEIMLLDMNRYLQKRLGSDDITPGIARRFSIRGELDLPECREEDHYLAPKGAPPRQYCALNYDMNVRLAGREIAFRRDRARGMGSSREAAWEDALLGVVEDLLPLIRETALVVSEKAALENLRQTLTPRDEDGWWAPKEYDVEAVLKFIRERMEAFKID